MNFHRKLVSALLVASGWMFVPILDRASPQAGALTKDTKIVANLSEPVPEKGRRKRIVFKEDLTIGVAEGDENYMFGKSVQVTADEKGAIYALDWDRKRIQKYDDQGKFLFSIGREGQGPGEFRNIWEMRFDGKGRIYASDNINKRVSFFNKENGRFEEAIKTEMNMLTVILLPNGTNFSSKYIQEVKGDAVSGSNTFGLYDKDFKPLIELHRQRLDFGAIGNLSNQAQFLAQIMSRSAFFPVLSSAVTDKGRIIMGYPETYEIKIFDFIGKLQAVVRKTAKPQAVSDRHKADDFEGRVVDFLSSDSSQLALKDEVRKFMTYPKYLPAYRRIIPMDNGGLFVVEDILQNVSRIDLFDDKGVYVGRFETDVPTGSLRFTNGRAYGVAVIGDFKYIKRYRYQIEEY